MEAEPCFIFQYANREGSSGMALELLRLHYSRVTPAYGRCLVKAVLSAREEAAAHAPEELAAATRIQAAYRRHVQQTAFQVLRRQACTIQRVYRGYATRKHLESERVNVRQVAYLQVLFDTFATCIQACYRGYYVRKTRANYYAQKEYLRIVASRSTQVVAQAHIAQIEQDVMRDTEAQRQYDVAYARHAARMHHTVSTRCIPSVYQGSVVLPSAALTAGNLALGGSASGAQNVESVVSRSSAEAAVPTSGRLGTPGQRMGEREKDEMKLSQNTAYVPGELVEEDIRYHARVARREHRALMKKANSQKTATASGHSYVSPHLDEEATAQPDAEPSPTTASSPHPQETRLPALKSTPARQQRQRIETPPSAAASVPWELVSTHPPKRPIVKPAPNLSAAAAATTFSQTTLSAAEARRVQDDWLSGHGDKASATGSHQFADVVGTAVSSFNRRFAVKRHDCQEHQLCCSEGVTTNGKPHLFSGPLSTAREDEALQRSVNQQVVQALHGDTVFKVPAARGRR